MNLLKIQATEESPLHSISLYFPDSLAKLTIILDLNLVLDWSISRDTLGKICNRVWNNTLLCNRPSGFLPFIQWKFSFPSTWLNSSFYPASLWLPQCNFYIPSIYHSCMSEIRKTGTWQKGATWWKICRPADVFTENPMRIYMPLGLLQRDEITTLKVIAAPITIRLKK